jgi:SAM-dependent methyltransferase
VLDCGAGTGRNLDWLRAFGAVAGIERSWVGLNVGRAHGRPLACGTVVQLPIADASVDVATSFDVLYCLDDDAETQAVREMWRVLKPGGTLVVNVAALDILRGSHSTLTMERRRYTKAGLTSLLTRAGFRVSRMTYTNTVTFPLTLAVRLGDRWRGRADVASDDDLKVPAAPVNAVLSGLLAIEGACLRVMNLPVGSSLLGVARKPATTATGGRSGGAG